MNSFDRILWYLEFALCVVVFVTTQTLKSDIRELQDAVQNLERRKFSTIRLTDKGFYRLDFEEELPFVLERETENDNDKR
ncbi:MAG: hypothetical protein IJO40_09170 [Thermoguttaceae bacterium]|nr:hypothetical protein [Thermoguttaceae bacterium]